MPRSFAVRQRYRRRKSPAEQLRRIEDLLEQREVLTVAEVEQVNVILARVEAATLEQLSLVNRLRQHFELRH